MPAIPIAVGAFAAYSGATAVALGTMSLAGVAAGATLLGGAAMVAGGLKGGAEGAKWAGQGGMLAMAGSLGMSATSAATAATDTAANQAAQANSTTGNFVDAAAAPTGTSTAVSDVGGQLMSPMDTATMPAPIAAPVTSAAPTAPISGGSINPLLTNAPPVAPNTSIFGSNGLAMMAGQAASGYAQGSAQQQMYEAQRNQQNMIRQSGQYNPLLSASNK